MGRTIGSATQGNPISYGKRTLAVTIGLVAIAFSAALGSLFLGPGVSDSSTHIAGGYTCDDVGGNEKMIVYRGNDRKSEIVIDARVDSYTVEESRVLVALRPRVISIVKMELSIATCFLVASTG